MARRAVLFFASLFFLIGDGGNHPTYACDDRSEGDASEEVLEVTIEWDDVRQTIHGFGASDAWSLQFVGKNWPLDERQRIVDWLFSTALDEDGNPEGIGLSIWRFNVGAGSAAQGEASGIRNPWRRTEGFMTSTRTYDWSRQQGQQWFLQAARQHGVPTTIAFVNSPPVELTKNGKAYGDGDGDANLAPNRYDDYARFLVTVLEHFEDEGLPFDYVSPVNEPQWNWSRSNGQEGSPYTNDEIVRLVGELAGQLQERSLSTKIELPEAAKISFLYASDTNYPDRDNQLERFFGYDHAHVQALPAVAPKVAAHSYFTTWPLSAMIQQRKRLARKMQAVDPSLAYWMSEYCILADNEEIQGGGRDLGMDPALYVARVIHFDLTLANASSWQWWLAVSPYDYKDGLIYIDKNKRNGEVHDSKLLWALGNYSRFVRPGYVRVDVSRSDQATELQTTDGLMVSAYQSASDERVVVVSVNYGTAAQELRLRIDGSAQGQAVQSWQPYVTSSAKDLSAAGPVSADSTAVVPARSVVTFVGDL